VQDLLGRERKIGAAYLDGLGQDKADEIQNPADAYLNNPLGFGVSVTKNGSMTRECMLDWTVHFIKNLNDGSNGEPKQGKGGEPVILTLDGHISRWNMHAIVLMLENNVLPFFSPSHTSMWGQMNDCGLNSSIQAFLEKAASKERMHQKTAPVAYHNRLIFVAWGDYVSTEHRTLLRTGTNVAKHSYFICGICPFNPGCMNWTGAIQTLGQKVLLEEEGCEKLKGWEVRVRQDDDANFLALTEEQAKLLMEGFEGFYGDERDLPIVAMLRAKSILARWREMEMDRLKQKERHFEMQHQERQQREVDATTEQQQQEVEDATEQQQQEEEDTPAAAQTPAEAAAALEAETEAAVAYFDAEAGINPWDNESNPLQHAVGEEEELALQLVHFVEANTIVQEMEAQGHDIGPPQPTADEITDTIISTTKMNKPVTLTYYPHGIDHEDSYIEGTAVKVGASDWLVCITGFPVGTIKSSTELKDPSKWMVHRPVEFLSGREHSNQMARIKRLDKCERTRMSDEANKKCKSDRESRKRDEFESMKTRVQLGTYEFSDFDSLWKLAEQPFTKRYNIYNRRTQKEEEITSVIKGCEQTATGTLVLTSLANVINSKNSKRSNDNTAEGQQRKRKKKNGVVTTILGECPFSALHKLRMDAKRLRAGDDTAAQNRLTSEYNELKKNYDAFMEYAATKRASGHDLWIVSALIDKSKGLDLYLRLFFPKSGILSKNNPGKEDFLLNGQDDGRHDFALTEISIMFRLEQIEAELAKSVEAIARLQTHEAGQANEIEGEAEAQADLQRDDESLLSMELDLEDDDDDLAIFGEDDETAI
jgi:hypothetical protein